MHARPTIRVSRLLFLTVKPYLIKKSSKVLILSTLTRTPQAYLLIELQKRNLNIRRVFLILKSAPVKISGFLVAQIKPLSLIVNLKLTTTCYLIWVRFSVVTWSKTVLNFSEFSLILKLWLLVLLTSTLIVIIQFFITPYFYICFFILLKVLLATLHTITIQSICQLFSSYCPICLNAIKTRIFRAYVITEPQFPSNEIVKTLKEDLYSVLFYHSDDINTPFTECIILKNYLVFGKVP